jgi:sulfate transport system permease protein
MFGKLGTDSIREIDGSNVEALHVPAAFEQLGSALGARIAAMWPIVATILVLLVVAGLVVLPVVCVFLEALSRGLAGYWSAISDPYTRHAAWLTVVAAFAAVALNLAFGLSAAWLIAKYRFPGRVLLLSILEIPLAVSPVVAGMLFVLLFGSKGVFAPILQTYDISIIFSLPGIILATSFVTLPYIARELIPVMEAQGSTEEEAALMLGAKGWQIFFLVTLPKVASALTYGLVLCSARAMGEFGAVSVVSGHIRGRTNTLPLHVEVLYNEFKFPAAFAVASILTILALVSLILKHYLNPRVRSARHV